MPETTWPVPRKDDAEMHDAIVKTIAQYILRGRAHRTMPVRSETQVMARTHAKLAEAAVYGYTFSQDAGYFAATAREFADWQQDRNPDWDDWAFGH